MPIERHFEISPDLLCTVAVDGTLREVNPAWTSTLGWTADELRGRRFLDLVHPDDREAAATRGAELVRGGAAAEVVNRCKRSDGGWRWIEWRAASSRPEGLIYASGRDVTRRRAAAAALESSERQTRQILETAHDAFISFDARGLITDWNPEAEAVFGWPRADVLGREFAATLVSPARRAGHRERIERYLTDGEDAVVGKRLERTLLHRDGREFPVELTISPLDTERGTSFNLLLRDITERHRSVEELALARDQALEASRMKSMFVANVSHEIRTPMNGVIGMTELLLETALDDEQRECAQVIAASGEALLLIIDDILDLSKIEAGKLELGATDFDLRETIARACSVLAARAASQGLDLVVDVSPDADAHVRGDAGRLRQVIVNLVSNAVKFTAAGAVVVRATAGPGREGMVAIRIEVADTGIGIEPEALERLFLPFSQADGSTTRRYGGTGLGLAISKHLIELMGGRIGAESEPGRGSTFWFELVLAAATTGVSPERQPRAVAPVGPAVDERAARGDRPSRPRVLVVEDTPINQTVAARMLENAGFQPRIAENGRRALEALAETSYDAILMDCQMPELDGYATTREIRGGETGGRRIPIIAMTANTMRGERERCLAAGMDDYLAKPLRSKTLTDALSLWIGDAPGG